MYIQARSRTKARAGNRIAFLKQDGQGFRIARAADAWQQPRGSDTLRNLALPVRAEPIESRRHGSLVRLHGGCAAGCAVVPAHAIDCCNALQPPGAERRAARAASGDNRQGLRVDRHHLHLASARFVLTSAFYVFVHTYYVASSRPRPLGPERVTSEPTF